MSLQRRMNVERWIDEAGAAFDAQVYDVASRAIAKALELDPGHLPARLLQARIELARNRPHLALHTLDMQQLHAHGETTPDAQWLYAVALARSRRFKDAVERLEILQENQPSDARIARLLAQLYRRMGQTGDAVRQLRLVRMLCPEDAASARLLARLVEHDQPSDAADLLGETPANQPASDDAREARQWERAKLCRQSGRLCDAEESIRNLLDQQPREQALWLEAAQIADEQGASALALHRASHAKTQGGEASSAALAVQAKVLMHNGRFGMAGRCWWQLTRHQPQDAAAWAGLLVCALQVHRPKLVDHARKHLRIHASKQQRRQLVATLWSVACAGRVMAQLRGEPDVQPVPQASVLDCLLASAQRTFAEHCEHWPRRADTHYHLAVCSKAMGEKAMAVDAVADALRVNPTYTSAQRLATDLGLTVAAA
ncbi:MAG: tetratricopeptide repeat protein [Phycisphaeraceae bacterium]|nr:tetratricopeptide repeat protein [Phycisphaeraceae bacterium]